MQPDTAGHPGIFDANREPVGLDDFGGAAAAFLNDDTSQKGAADRTTFSGAGGSNKNNDPISAADCAARVPPLTGSACDSWHWDAGNVPAKDDLVTVYAYAKIRPSDNHLIIYSGFERLDPNGDSHIDLEFLKDPDHVGSPDLEAISPSQAAARKPADRHVTRVAGAVIVAGSVSLIAGLVG